GDSSIQDYFNLRNERSLSAFDVPQRLVVSFDYQLPLGRGRTLGKNMNRVLDAVIGGWEVSGIISAASRTPLGITQSASTLWIGSQRPNQIGDPSVAGAVRDKLNNYFNVKAFSSVGPDLIGNAPRFLATYRGANLVNEDAALMKNFNIREGKYVQ